MEKPKANIVTMKGAKLSLNASICRLATNIANKIVGIMNKL